MTASPPIATDRAAETAFLINDALRKGERHLEDARWFAEHAATERGMALLRDQIRGRVALWRHGRAVVLRRRLELGL